MVGSHSRSADPWCIGFSAGPVVPARGELKSAELASRRSLCSRRVVNAYERFVGTLEVIHVGYL